MKIAMYTTTGERCGIASYTRDLVSALRALPQTEVEVVPIIEGKQTLEHYTEIAKKLNASDIDVIHIQHEHSFWGGILPKASAFWQMRYLLKKPLVLTAHTTYSLAEMLRLKEEKRPPQRIVKEILIRRKAYRHSVEIAPFATALTVVHTEAARQELIERGAKPNYVAVIPAGIPSNLPAAAQNEFRKRFGLEGKFVLTIFGYTAPNKGYELTLEALKTLPPQTILLIAGGPRNADMNPYLETLKARIAAEHLTERVVISGFLSEEEIGQAMAAADLVLVPHTQATGSYSVTIPLAYGKPILASDQDCFREMNERRECLRLFKSGDREDLSCRALALIEDKGAQNELARKAGEYAKKYSWANSARLTRNVYTRVIELFSPGNW